MEVIQNYMLLGQEIRVLKNGNKADFSVSKLHVTPRYGSWGCKKYDARHKCIVAVWIRRLQKIKFDEIAIVCKNFVNQYHKKDCLRKESMDGSQPFAQHLLYFQCVVTVWNVQVI